ncbi:MAG: RrF2 family transcriptional regulator, partial [Spirochaetota bacterium]
MLTVVRQVGLVTENFWLTGSKRNSIRYILQLYEINFILNYLRVRKEGTRMRFSTGLEYAIHGLVYLATVPPGKAVLISEVASAIGVSETYLRKVFQQLSRSGILHSQRGVGGGFWLAREPGEITLKDVVDAIDGSLPVYT